MKAISMRYSPTASDVYGARSALIGDDVQAHNLLWLSYDPDKGANNDPLFTTHIRRSLQFVISDGAIDLIDAVRSSRKVRGLMNLPPPAAVKAINELKHLSSLPLFLAYGQTWLETIERRSRLYREPHHAVMDAPVLDLSQALLAINACR